MLYVIHGTDTSKVKKKATQLVEMLQQKRPDASLFKVNKESWYPDFFAETIPAISLFSPKNIVVMDSLLEDDTIAEMVFQNLDELKNTEHVCILIEGKLTKEYIKKVTAKAEKVEEHNKTEAPQKREAPQTFALADALLQKNKRKAFEVFQKLRAEEVVGEEIHGVLWWQFKSLYLVLNSKSAGEADLNPFVYSKCKSVEKNWSVDLVAKTLDSLVDIYHKAHRGEVDLLVELEKLCV
jgi:DNA polymerase III delta subunit